MAKTKILSKRTEVTNSAKTPNVTNVTLDKVKGGEKPKASKAAAKAKGKKGY